MKGIIFNLLEDVVTLHHGADIWDEMLDQANVAGIYTSLGSYPDEEMSLLLTSAANLLALQPNEVTLWFGRHAVPFLLERYPHFFKAESTRLFLMGLNSLIHHEARMAYASAIVPLLDFKDAEDGALVVGYHSDKFCILAQGFSEGTADYYKEVIDFQHLSCIQHGDDKCVFRISFSKTC